MAIKNQTKLHILDESEEEEFTIVSISRSRRSLMVHPAPRRSKAPHPNNVIILISGRCPGLAAKLIDLETIKLTQFRDIRSMTEAMNNSRESVLISNLLSFLLTRARRLRFITYGIIVFYYIYLRFVYNNHFLLKCRPFPSKATQIYRN